MEQDKRAAGPDSFFIVRARVPKGWTEGKTYETRLHYDLIRDERVRNPIYVDTNMTRGRLRVICDGRIDPFDMMAALADRGFFSIRKGDEA